MLEIEEAHVIEQCVVFIIFPGFCGIHRIYGNGRHGLQNQAASKRLTLLART